MEKRKILEKRQTLAKTDKHLNNDKCLQRLTIT